MSSSEAPPKRRAPRRPPRRKRSYSNREHDDEAQAEVVESEPVAKKPKFEIGDYRRRSARVRKKVNYNEEALYRANRAANTSTHSNASSPSRSSSSTFTEDESEDEEIEIEEVQHKKQEDAEEQQEEEEEEENEDESDENDFNDEDDDDDEEEEEEEEEEEGEENESPKPIFTAHATRNCRSCRVIVSNDGLTEDEVLFKQKAYQYVNNQFQHNFTNAQQIWNAQRQKQLDSDERRIQQKRDLKVAAFARDEVITHETFLNTVSQNVSNAAKYLHITGTVHNHHHSNTDQPKQAEPDASNAECDGERIDVMIEPKAIPLNRESCPIPHSTAYVTVNRCHYVKDDKKLRYIPQISDSLVDNLNTADLYDSSDSDTEFEEQEDMLLKYMDEHLELDDETTRQRLQKLFFLNVNRIQHRIRALSHDKQNLLKQQKQQLLKQGYDPKNKDIPIDSFSLLFCPRCMTYDCSLHGLDNPRRRNRALPSDTALAANCDYFGIINEKISDPNSLADISGNHSSCNHMIPHLLPKEYKPSVTYPPDLAECTPCNSHCYISYLRKQNETRNNNKRSAEGEEMEIEWSYMDLANLRRLLNICKKNFCQIAAILGHIPCKHVYLKCKQLIPDIEPYVKVTADDGNKQNAKKPRKQQRDTAAVEMREPIELSAENVPHQFFGCKHDGACSVENNCSCMINQTYCEKFCNCSIECTRRFPGCACRDGQCQTNACPCFRSHRECDPDQCKSCQSYLPVHVVEAAIEWLKQNAPDYYSEHYAFHPPHNNKADSKRASSSSSSLSSLACNDSSNNETKEDKEKEDEKDSGDGAGSEGAEEKKAEDKYENVSVELLGIPNVNPFKLCENCRCTQERKKKLWIGRSDIHGFGCFAGESIRKDEYITEYLGELISQHEADRRGKVYDEQNISYLFNLNEEYCVDATRKGCKMKFANHSIKPNCRAKIITVNGDHRICIYAKKDLQKGEELLFDYRHDNVDNAQQPTWFHYNQK